MSDRRPGGDERGARAPSSRGVVHVALVIVLAAVTVAALACSSGEAGPKPSDPRLAQGWQVYKDHCATCHGPDGGGGAGPKLAGTVVADFPNIGDQITVIENGKGAGAMPAWKGTLSTDEIEAVAEYTRKCLGNESC